MALIEPRDRPRADALPCVPTDKRRHAQRFLLETRNGKLETRSWNSELLWPGVDILEEEAIRRLEHDLVVSLGLALGEVGPVTRCLEEHRNAVLGQFLRGGVDISLAFGCDRNVVHPRTVVVVDHPGRAGHKPETDAVLLNHPDALITRPDRVPAQK